MTELVVAAVPLHMWETDISSRAFTTIDFFKSQLNVWNVCAPSPYITHYHEISFPKNGMFIIE